MFALGHERILLKTTMVAVIVCETFPLSRKFSEEFLSTFAGQKIPKEGTCFDYFYDWQSDAFKDWGTKVRVK